MTTTQSKVDLIHRLEDQLNVSIYNSHMLYLIVEYINLYAPPPYISLKTLRRGKGVSKLDLAEEHKLPLYIYKDIESGKGKITTSLLAWILEQEKSNA